jgi:iron complex outermembrane receptor protein
MSRLLLLRGASAIAISCAIVPTDATAQVVLPTIEVESEQAGKSRLQPPDTKLQLDIPVATSSRLGLTPRETPASIVIIDNATLRARGVETTQQALAGAPGVTFAAPPGAAGSVSMRGFGTTSITQLFNGITVQYDAIAARPLDSWLFDHIEVLGGPASFLWGQGAVGGVINYVSKVAYRGEGVNDTWSSIGSFLDRRISYGFNGPIGNAAPSWLQLTTSYTGSNGYVGGTPFTSGAASGSLLTDITPQLSHLVAVEVAVEDRDAYWGTPLLNPYVGGRIVPWGTAGLPVITGKIDPGTRFKNYNSWTPIFDQQVLWVRDILSYRPSDALQFVNTLYFYRADRQYENVEVYRWNRTNTLIDRTAAFATKHVQSLVGNRFEGTYQTDLLGMPLTTAAGIDASWNAQTRYPSLEPSTGLVSTVSPYFYTVGSYFQTIFPNGTRPTGWAAEARGQLNTVAFFNENRLFLTPQMQLVTGIRWENIDFTRTNLRAPTAPTVANPFGNPALYERTYQPLSWRTAMMYNLTPTANIYVTYSTAADPPAGILLTGTAAALRDFNLTTGNQIEAGTKFDFLDGIGTATLAGYFIERSNLTIPDPLVPGSVLPVGKQSSNGIEANLGLLLAPGLGFQGNMAWINPRFDRFDETVEGISVSRAGNRPPNQPLWVANAWLTWNFLPDWNILLSARYVGDRYADNANRIRVPAYATFDAALSWSFGPRASLTARVRNLTDKEYVSWATGTPLYILGAPRTFLMELATTF